MDLGNMSGNRRGLTGTNIKYKRNNRYYETADKFVWHLRRDGQPHPHLQRQPAHGGDGGFGGL